MRSPAIIALLVLGSGCGGGSGDGPADAGGEGSADGATACPRAPAPASRARSVVVSKPYGQGAQPSARYELLALAVDGTLSATSESFEMRRSLLGRIVFTPDGEVGLVAQEDGTLGVFRIAAGGEVTVVHAAFSGAFYASSVVVAAEGDRAFVVDPNFEEHGGGVYEVAIGCDGTLSERGLIAQARSARAVVLGPGGDLLVAARRIADSPAGFDLHVLDLSEPAVVAGVDAFGDDEAIVSDAALTAGGGFVLVGDNNQFSGIPNRVAVVAADGRSLTPAGTLEIEDPISIATSPHGDVALVASGFGDAAFVLELAPGGATYRVRGELAYSGPSPKLPGAAVAVERGELAGLVLLAENVGVRRIRFHSDGSVEDLGLFSTGEGIEAIPGTLGVQP